MAFVESDYQYLAIGVLLLNLARNTRKSATSSRRYHDHIHFAVRLV